MKTPKVLSLPNSPVRRVSEVQTELVFAVKDTPPVGVSCAGRKQIGGSEKGGVFFYESHGGTIYGTGIFTYMKP